MVMPVCLRPKADNLNALHDSCISSGESEMSIIVKVRRYRIKLYNMQAKISQ